MGFRWVTETCNSPKLIIKLDDDVFFDVRKFFSRYWQVIGNDRKNSSIHCLVWHNAEVGRTGKWKVSKEQFPDASYPFPYCAGFFVVITPDLIRPMYLLAKSLNFFWIDDIFLYGMVPASMKGVHFNQIGRSKSMITEWFDAYKSCRKQKGRNKCSYFVSVTDGDKQFDEVYDSLFSKSSYHE